ncbi:nascent polypeptide-associated complex protein [Candidatus Pacearchaeota archaeon]|nr:nascent polypeptide-associated complex protein [Candidatus Pacearchaeota archaeon]
MEAIMKQMGISQQEIQADKVIIEKTDGSKIIIEPAQVTKIQMQGADSFQIAGDIKEEAGEKFSEEDIKLIMEKTGANKEKAKKTLEKTQDIAEAIVELSD